MSHTEQILYSEIIRLYRRTRQPARTSVLAELTAYSERWARRVLAKLEARGVVRRKGQRGGWLPNYSG